MQENRRPFSRLRRILPRLVIVGIFLGGLPAAFAAKAKAAKAELTVQGLGWLQEHEIRRTLVLLLDTENKGELDANALDDAAFLLVSILTEQGYLTPKVDVAVETATAVEHYTFAADLEGHWPRTLRARALRFKVTPGVRSHVVEVKFSGLMAVPAKVAQSYFRAERSIFSRAGRAYSPARGERGRTNLQSDLQRRGYADAQVGDPLVRQDAKSGAVSLTVPVTEGPLWTVRSVRIEDGASPDTAAAVTAPLLNQPWSSLWQQNLVTAVRKDFYGRGFPDVVVHVASTTAPEAAVDGVAVAVTAEVTPGEQVRVGSVRFEGAKRTKPAVLRRRVETGPGDLLNPLQLEQARARLSRLGVFESVNLSYDPATGPVRSPVFALEEGRYLETNLLFGYGSYEQVRGGIELRQFNLFGHAHSGRLLLLQSMKSSSLDYTYSVPDLFGETIDGSARLFGLQREEFSFVRQEYGGSVQLKRPLAWLGAEATTGYTIQVLRNLDNALSTRGVDDKQSVVASVDGSLVRDRRDNPLRPRRGYKLSAKVEAAGRQLGSEVEYQRIELDASYHTAMGENQWLHLGLSHGVITTLGSDDRDLPVNKRFYPGGDNSIRGFREGEAAPRDPTGRFVGAKSYLLANVEVEQALARDFSLVEFVDGIGVAARLADYPFKDRLYSAGLGFRYQTLIGPVRLEYGRNLNRRPFDPSGTWLLSVGVPF